MKTRTDPTGFTLIEVLVSMIVLSVAIVVIMQLLSISIKSIPNNDLYTRAVFLARTKMEEILLSETPSIGQSSGMFDENKGWIINISEYKDENENKQEIKKTPGKEDKETHEKINLLRIDLCITWIQEGKTKSYTVSTLKNIAGK